LLLSSGGDARPNRRHKHPVLLSSVRAASRYFTKTETSFCAGFSEVIASGPVLTL